MGRWTEVTLGEEIGPLRFEITPAFNARFIGATGNDLPIHAAVADPTIAGNLAISLLGSRYPGPIIHSHQEIRCAGTVPVGTTVTATGRVSMKQMRRGKAYVAIDCEFDGGAGPVWFARMTCVWPEVHLRGEL